jgi:uncharacterized damage-inducible protein DinB
MLRALLCLVFAVPATAQDRMPFQDDMWREFDLYRGRLLQLARAIPEEKYDWRPGEGVRSVKEVLLHVGLTNYMLLDMMGLDVPKELFPELPAKEPERQRAIFRKGGEYEKQVKGKSNTVATVESAFAAVDRVMKETSAAGLNKPAMFGDRKTTIGGLQLRIVAHLHEHLGQLIAYSREVGVTPPWSQ